MRTLLSLADSWLKTLPKDAPTPWQLWLLRLLMIVLMSVAGFLAGAVLAFLVFGFTAGPSRNVVPALVAFGGSTLFGFGYGVWLVLATLRR